MAKREETLNETSGCVPESEIIEICEADLARFGGKVRLDRFLAAKFPELGRSRIQAAIDAGCCKIGGKAAKSSSVLTPGVKVAFEVALVPAPPELTLEPKALEAPLEIIFEDDHIIVVNKPAGVTVHPGAGTQGEVTLVHAILAHCGSLPETGAGTEQLMLDSDGEPADEAEPGVEGSGFLSKLRPGIVHRLDRDTSGVLVVAKTVEAHRHLAAQFHDKTNFRQYLVLCVGAMPTDAVMRESWLGRDSAHRTRFRSYGEDGGGRKYAKTVFRRESVFSSGCTLMSARLYTGRTHQIRVHARDIGLPVVGDASYGDDSRLPADLKALATRQMLHAWKLGFTHPLTSRRMDFEAPLPADFSAILAHLSA